MVAALEHYGEPFTIRK